MAGMAGESLLLVRTQVLRFESLLQDDFRVLMFLKNDLPESQVKIVGDKLLGLPEVREARFVSRDAALTALRRDDPELVDSVTWMGDNPLRPAFEVRPTPAALGRFDEWLERARGVSDWSDLRYRAGQVRAILQGHFLSLILSFLLCLACAALAAALWWTPWPGASRPTTGEGPPPSDGSHSPSLKGTTFARAAAGAAVGLLLALGAAWPARQYLPWWQMPAVGSQLAVWAAAALAAGLFSFP
jgi:hypothetical protein